MGACRADGTATAGSFENESEARLPSDVKRVLSMNFAHERAPWSPYWQRYAGSVQVRARACVRVRACECACVCVRACVRVCVRDGWMHIRLLARARRGVCAMPV